MLKQYIITRFNLPLWKRDKRRVDTRSEAWLEDRFRLFETYCLPSVCAQKEQDFGWILLFDAETPARFRERAQGWMQRCPQMRLIAVREELAWNWVMVFREVILSELDGTDCDRIVTTYLDNDDALHGDFLSEVRRAAETAEENTFFTFKHGMQYYEQKNYALELDYMGNHFISLVEKPTVLRTCIGYGGHSKLCEYKGVNVVDLDKGRRMWTEVVHGRNVANDVLWFRFRRVSDKGALQAFGLERNLRTDAWYFVSNHYVRIVRQFFIRGFRRLFGRETMKAIR